MLEFFSGLIGEAFKRVDYAIVHMSQFQISVVAIVAVVIGFLALRSNKIQL